MEKKPADEAKPSRLEPPAHPGEIVTLNVGGKRFATSKQTLTWVPDSFFSSLMSGRIPSLRDETGALFIDRDPEAFAPILNFLRTRNVELRNVDLKALKHEAEFYGIHPLVKRLAVCSELDKSNCGSILFYSKLQPPVFDAIPTVENSQSVPQPQLQLGLKTDFSRQILQIVGHGNCIAAAYNHCVCVLSARESRGWDVLFTSPPLDKVPQRIALTTRCVGGAAGAPILAVVLGSEIKVWSCGPTPQVLASFDMKIPGDGLFFVGMQLVAISNTGKVAVWQSVQKHWQLQEVEPICSYDMAGYFLLLGCTNGSIYYIDMEKFPVRMKDNDLLVTQLFEDPCQEPITALSVYCTPTAFPGSGQNWMEVAYGTREGSVRVVVRHPENIGQAPQIFQSYNVHTCPILRVVLGEKHLVSVCAENHVRSWTVTRFRGRISTQPGSSPIASFKVLSLEGAHSLFYPINSIGPFGDRDTEQVFIQRVIPETNQIFIRLSSTGERVCKIESVDESNISTYCVHECETANRIGMRSKRFIFTGHVNGCIQVWDLATALEMSQKNQEHPEGGPTKEELLDLIQNCDISASRASSVVSSRAPSPSPSLMSIMYPGIKQPQLGRGSLPGTPSSISRLIGSSGGGGGGGGAANALANLFQPIHNSLSSTSLNSSAALNSVSVQVRPAVYPVEEESNSAVQSKHGTEGQDEFGVDGDNERQFPSEVCTQEKAFVGASEGLEASIIEEIPALKSASTASSSSIHQRSRSNEIDYNSVCTSARGQNKRPKSVSAFQSPPGTVRGVLPLLSLDSAHGSLLTDSLASAPCGGSGSSNSSHISTTASDVTLADGESSSSSSGAKEGQKSQAVSSSSPPYWSRDIALSDYFSSNEDHLQVTDC